MGPEFFDAVRVHPEPFDYWTERMVHDALVRDPAGYLAFLDRSLAKIAAGDISVDQPSKLVFSDRGSEGDFRVMPCVVHDDRAARKVVKIVGTNVVQESVRDQITVGKAFCLDARENYVTHVIEACLLSSARTGACAAIALKTLGADRRRVTIIGAGRVGSYAALYIAALGDVDEVGFIDADEGRAERAARLATDHFSSATTFRAHSRGSAIAGDAIVLATTARTPLLAPSDTTAPLVISTGADTVHQHELTPEWAAIADVYVDTRDGFQVGDLQAWLAQGRLSSARVVNLIDVYRDGARGERPRRVFISTGSALFDNLTISYLLDRIGSSAITRCHECGAPRPAE
jgi:ornithine cyclodeaminase/alanine dehydrogenase-like protein (mu-crystallin family)